MIYGNRWYFLVDFAEPASVIGNIATRLDKVLCHMSVN